MKPNYLIFFGTLLALSDAATTPPATAATNSRSEATVRIAAAGNLMQGINLFETTTVAATGADSDPSLQPARASEAALRSRPSERVSHALTALLVSLPHSTDVTQILPKNAETASFSTKALTLASLPRSDSLSKPNGNDSVWVLRNDSVSHPNSLFLTSDNTSELPLNDAAVQPKGNVSVLPSSAASPSPSPSAMGSNRLQAPTFESYTNNPLMPMLKGLPGNKDEAKSDPTGNMFWRILRSRAERNYATKYVIGNNFTGDVRYERGQIASVAGEANMQEAKKPLKDIPLENGNGEVSFVSSVRGFNKLGLPTPLSTRVGKSSTTSVVRQMKSASERAETSSQSPGLTARDYYDVPPVISKQNPSEQRRPFEITAHYLHGLTPKSSRQQLKEAWKIKEKNVSTESVGAQQMEVNDDTLRAVAGKVTLRHDLKTKTNTAAEEDDDDSQRHSWQDVAVADGRNRYNLEKLEKELSNKVSSSDDLLLAISILQHHGLPTTVSSFLSPNVVDIAEIVDLKEEMMHSNEESVELDEEMKRTHAKMHTSETEEEVDTENKIQTENRDTPANSFAAFQAKLPNTMFAESALNADQNPYKKESHINENAKDFAIDMPDAGYSDPHIELLPHSILLDEMPHKLPRVKIANTADKHSKISIMAPAPYFSKASQNSESTKWFILVMDGHCGIISKRMNTFVMFLKAALSSRMNVDFNDIMVMSVFCDNTFMVNITLSESKYSEALRQLRKLADANTTLLEISGEIFYLEKVIPQGSPDIFARSHFKLNPETDAEKLIYIGVGCFCLLSIVSVFVVAVFRFCSHAERSNRNATKSSECIDRTDIPIRRPNVIYSHKFTEQLNPEKYSQTPFEEAGEASVDSNTLVKVTCPEEYLGEEDRYSSNIATVASGLPFLGKPTHSFSRMQLLEEVPDEEEYEDGGGGVLDGDEDYHDDEDEMMDFDDEYDDEFLIQSINVPETAVNSICASSSLSTASSRQLEGKMCPHHGLGETGVCCHTVKSICENKKSPFPDSFDNPCYVR